MKQLFEYTFTIWYMHGNEDKEFMERTVIAESDEIATELARSTRRNITSVQIDKKEPYNPPIDKNEM